MRAAKQQPVRSVNSRCPHPMRNTATGFEVIPANGRVVTVAQVRRLRDGLDAG
jgi:hypothetical protein